MALVRELRKAQRFAIELDVVETGDQRGAQILVEDGQTRQALILVEQQQNAATRGCGSWHGSNFATGHQYSEQDARDRSEPSRRPAHLGRLVSVKVDRSGIDLMNLLSAAGAAPPSSLTSPTICSTASGTRPTADEGTVAFYSRIRCLSPTA